MLPTWPWLRQQKISKLAILKPLTGRLYIYITESSCIYITESSCLACVEYYILRDTYEKESERWQAERCRVCVLYYVLCMYIVCVCVVCCVTYVYLFSIGHRAVKQKQTNICIQMIMLFACIHARYVCKVCARMFTSERLNF